MADKIVRRQALCIAPSAARASTRSASSSPARRCSSATSASSSATTSSARKAASTEAAARRPQQAADAARDPPDPRPVRDRPGAGEEDPLGRGLQPLQAARDRRQGRRGRARQVEHPADRPHGLGQDAARADARAPARRAVRDRRCDDADRSRLRRRGRREHHPEAAAEVRLRHREGAARHRLHRRDRQDLAQERQPVDHARRLGRRRAAGAAEADRRHDRQRAAAGRAQASEPGVRAGRHDQHPVRLRRRVRRPGEDHPPAHGQDRHRLRRRGREPGRPQEHDACCCARPSPRT